MKLSSHIAQINTTHIMLPEFRQEELHPVEVRSHTLNSPMGCNAFAATFFQFFRANFTPWKAHHLSYQGNPWVDILPFSLWLTAEEQLQLVVMLFAVLELSARGYR